MNIQQVMREVEYHIHNNTGDVTLYPYAGAQFVAGILETIFTSAQHAALLDELHSEDVLMVYDYTNSSNTKRAIVSCTHADCSQIVLSVDGQLSWNGLSAFAQAHPDTTITITSVTKAGYPKVAPRGTKSVNGNYTYNVVNPAVPIWKRAAYSLVSNLFRNLK